MNQSGFNDEILRIIRDKSKNNLKEILNNFTDIYFETYLANLYILILIL